MTCDKVAINGPNLNKLAPKKNHTGESGDERKKNHSANPCAFITERISIYEGYLLI